MTCFPGPLNVRVHEMALSQVPRGVVRATSKCRFKPNRQRADGAAPRAAPRAHAMKRRLPAVVVVVLGLVAAVAYVRLTDWAEEK